eukprot:TRINITY_DN27743_c0_g1_i1.p1 TRINITY_DN27743_c0_g1~~TRINITY_DN27743_c0_g1_i1.p1  ORF type:complete len:476 (+),score=147.36 TRINITY_DN27743_c0_g1_i1:39-1466(+)
MRPVLYAGLAAAAALADDAWKFEEEYPAHYVAPRLAPGEEIVVDGKLDDKAWEAVPWTTEAFQDIAAPLYPDGGRPTAEFQTQVKVRWDERYLYVGVALKEPLVWGNITGHNENLTSHHPPYYNNDFEVFVDVSGSTHWYKEFEMSARNATYDVLWRVPGKGLNSLGVPCNDGDGAVYCQNSTYNKGDASMAPQTWSMWGGLKTATATPSAFQPFESGQWTAEIAFPIAEAGGHGGLLSTDGGKDPKWDYTKHDPNKGARFWWVDFARAEHPLRTIGAAPLEIDFTTKEYSAFCAEVKARHPSLLGTDQWSCYWEFTWQHLGHTMYMHNPEMWGVVQFADSSRAVECKTPTWPARYIAFQLHRAQIRHFLVYKSYATAPANLTRDDVCRPEYDCDPAALERALSVQYKHIYDISLTFDDPRSTACPNYAAWTPTGAPCFTVTVATTDPHSKATYTVVVEADRHTTESGVGATSCL